MTIDTTLLDAAHRIVPVIRQYREEAERERRLSTPVVEAMGAAGLWRLGTPPAVEALPANAKFCCDGETFALMMCGRTGLDAAMAGGQIVPEGDMACVQTFKKWFQGV